MKILISINMEDTLVYYKIEKNDLGRAIKRVQYIFWRFNNSVEKNIVYIGTANEIYNLLKFVEEKI